MSLSSVSKILIILFCCTYAVISTAQPEFIQIIEDSDSGEVAALELAVVRYVDQYESLSVDLISALHIADQSYYDHLNQLFTEYDVVLFELVTDTNVANINEPLIETSDNSAETESKNNLSGVSRVQVWLKNTLGLAFQLDAIDYSAANFVHADFTPAEFNQSLAENNETMFSEMVRLWRASILHSLMQPGQTGDLGLFQAFFASDRDRRLKQAFARQFADMNTLEKLLSGKEGSTLVTARNKKAMQVLNQQVERGATRIGVFYGAAHMPDFHRRLVKGLDMQPDSTRWVEAWNLR